MPGRNISSMNRDIISVMIINMNSKIKLLKKAMRGMDPDVQYHAINDLCGVALEYVKDDGYFHRILEEDF